MTASRVVFAGKGAPPLSGQPVESVGPAVPSPPVPLPEAGAHFVPEPLAPGPHSPTLSLEELQSIAQGNNPALARAAANVRAAQGRWVQAGLYANPFIGYNGTQIGDGGTAGQQGAYFGQTLILGNKLRLSRAAASQEVREAQQQFDAARLRVLTDVRLRYVDAVVAQRSVRLTGQLTEVGQKGVTAAEALFNAKEVGQVDLLQARIEFEQARILRIRAENRARAAWQGLVAVIGLPLGEPTELVDVLDRPGPPRTWDDAWMRVMAMSPELGAASARVSRAVWTLARARREPIPNLDNQFMVQHDNRNFEDIVMVQSTVIVPLFNRNQGAIQDAGAQLSAARADYARLERALQARLALAFERYSNARQQVERYVRDILPSAQKTLELVTAGYRQGEFPFLNYLTAQRTYFQVNLSYVDALREYWQSEAVIDGLLLSDSLEAATP